MAILGDLQYAGVVIMLPTSTLGEFVAGISESETQVDSAVESKSVLTSESKRDLDFFSCLIND